MGALSNRLKKEEAQRKKRKIDRKLLKERKIRYVMIPELLSFMVSEIYNYT